MFAQAGRYRLFTIQLALLLSVVVFGWGLRAKLSHYAAGSGNVANIIVAKLSTRRAVCSLPSARALRRQRPQPAALVLHSSPQAPSTACGEPVVARTAPVLSILFAGPAVLHRPPPSTPVSFA